MSLSPSDNMVSKNNGFIPKQTILHAGPFSMMYENGFIRYIRYGETEIVRMIYLTLRIQNWETCEPLLENEIVQTGEKSFTVSYTCHHKKDNQILFSWDVVIVGSEDGAIKFSISGKAIQDFLKNRAGFCILHPIKNTAGNKISITHGDGHITDGFFPENIAPVCPFTDIRKMLWENSGHPYIIEMKGDLFEMEDHRNWTDNSFKTYCTLQDLPYPVKLTEGAEVIQEIIFYPVDKMGPPVLSTETNVVHVSVKDGPRLPFPAIGVGSSTELSFITKTASKTIQEIGFDFYTVHVKPAAAGWKENFKRETEIASQLDLKLFVTLELTNQFEKELAECESVFRPFRSELKYILLLDEKKPVTSTKLTTFGSSFIRKFFPETQIGAGTQTNFAEFNRNKIEGAAEFDFVSYSVHPQEHAFDNLTIVENIEAQGTTVQSAKLLYPNSNIIVNAVTLKKRLNPYARNPADIIQPEEKKADNRQTGLWAAGWTLGSFKFLSEAGVQAASYFQTIGKQGISNENGDLYPAGLLLQKVLALKEGEILQTVTSDPLSCSSFLVSVENTRYLFVANHTDKRLLIKTPFAFSNIEKIEIFATAEIMLTVDRREQIWVESFGVYLLS